MKDAFVTYEIAKQLKDLGFDEPCLAYFDADKDLFTQRYTGAPQNRNSEFFPPEKTNNPKISAPLWQQAMDFLRERFGIFVNINAQAVSLGDEPSTFVPNGKYAGTLDDVTKGKKMCCSDTICLIKTCNTYAEAREKGIMEAIERIQKGLF